MDFLIGIDEAGRGPLAGPVAVGAAMVRRDFDWSFVKGAKDSKQMTPASREVVYETMRSLRENGTIDFAVAFSSAGVIDQRGIVLAIRSALSRALTTVTSGASLAKPWRSTGIPSRQYEVLLDGGLYAPVEFVHQRTIIRGDESEPIISLASIAAKVERDRLMRRLSIKYPAYGFDIHKGYGTATHRRLISENGLSKIHRTTFCKNIA